MQRATMILVCTVATLSPAAHAADYTIQAGSTNVTVYLTLRPFEGYTISDLADIAYSDGNLKVYYVRDGIAATQITTASQTVTGTYTSGGWVKLDSTNAPGRYRLDLPNGVCASGRHAKVMITYGGEGMGDIDIDLIGYDPTAANLPANVTQWLNQGVEGPDQNGVPKVDVAYVEGNGLGTHVSGYFPSDVRQWRSNAVPAAHANGYPIVTVKDGTGTGEIDTFNGLVSLTPASKKALGWIFSGVVDTVTNATTYIITDTNGEVAPPGSLVVFLDASNGNRPSVRRVITNDSAGNLTIDSAPDFTVATNDGVEFIATPTQLPAAAPGAAGGLFIAGANAATTVNITGNITGDLSGSVGSVSGDVGGNVVGSVGSISGVTFPANFGGMTITSGRVNADVTHWLTAPVATPNQAGTPTVDITHVLGSPVCD